MSSIKNSLLNKIWMSVSVITIIMSGCDRSEIDNIIPGSNDNASGDFVDISISLQDTPATRSVKPLISEYVKLNTFSATRSPGESDDPKMIGLMELSEDTVSAFPLSRGFMVSNAQFRLIAFQKVGGNYVYQTDAVYKDSGAGAPELIGGKMLVPKNHTYRFVGYSFNKAETIWASGNYEWGITSVPISDLDADFATFDSGDQSVVVGDTYQLPVTFERQLCKLNVTVVANKGSSAISISNCTGVYIKEGGDELSWGLGLSGITSNTNSTAAVDFSSNSGVFNLAPFADSKQITVHFNTITVDGTVLSHVEFTSQQSVQLLAGKIYNLKIQIEEIGIQVPASDINLGGTGCSQSDKLSLSQLKWAEGNLKSTDNSKPYEWAASQSDYGYYYTWNSTFGGAGSTAVNNTDPCSKLDVDKYGSGWSTPSTEVLQMLSRCTDKVLTNGGMWFMNKSIGLFLPAAGGRSFEDGSGTTATIYVGSYGYYWGCDGINSSIAYYLTFGSGSASITDYSRTYGFSVRCVK